jgi:hypothetical protein
LVFDRITVGDILLSHDYHTPQKSSKFHFSNAATIGAALVAATIFTLPSGATGTEPEKELNRSSVTVTLETLNRESLTEIRSYSPSRSAMRIAQDIPGDYLLEPLPIVQVTPAPVPCSFTGLSHLPETDDGCRHPSTNGEHENRALGMYLAAMRDWTGNQWQCLDNLMTRESRWRHTAANPVSSARGIPQKMMSVHYGAGWRTSATAAAWLADPEAQIEWGLDYITRRYNNPCGAWGHFQRNGWY